MDIHSRLFIVCGYPFQNFLAWISVLGFQCGYPLLYGYLKTNIKKSWISMLISVDFWMSMYGYAMDSRSRDDSEGETKLNCEHISQFKLWLCFGYLDAMKN